MLNEKTLKEIGNVIVDEAEYEYISDCNVLVESAEDGSWLTVEDAPDLQKLIKKIIKEHLPNLSKEDTNEIIDYVNDIVSEENLCDRAIEDYRDRLGEDYEE